MPRLSPDGDRVVAIGDDLFGGLLVVEPGSELIEVGDLKVCAEPQAALRGREFTEQHPQERGLARPVGPDDAHPIAPHERCRKTAKHRWAPRMRKPHFLEPGHKRTAPLRLLDRQFGGALSLPPRLPLPAHRFQGPHPALVAGAARLDPLPDPAFLLGQSLVEECVVLLLG